MAQTRLISDDIDSSEDMSDAKDQPGSPSIDKTDNLTYHKLMSVLSDSPSQESKEISYHSVMRQVNVIALSYLHKHDPDRYQNAISNTNTPELKELGNLTNANLNLLLKQIEKIQAINDKKILSDNKRKVLADAVLMLKNIIFENDVEQTKEIASTLHQAANYIYNGSKYFAWKLWPLTDKRQGSNLAVDVFVDSWKVERILEPAERPSVLPSPSKR